MIQIGEKINVSEIKEKLKRNEAGAIVIFLGEPRRSREDGDVISINYTAYKEMAISEAEKIEKEAREKFPIIDIAICHRLGNIPLKEISFLVGVSSAHRKEAFEACAWITDEVKKRLPVWKEIIYEGSRNSKQSNQ